MTVGARPGVGCTFGPSPLSGGGGAGVGETSELDGAPGELGGVGEVEAVKSGLRTSSQPHNENTSEAVAPTRMLTFFTSMTD